MTKPGDQKAAIRQTPPKSLSRLSSVSYALQGLAVVLATQTNFRIQLVGGMAGIILGFLWHVSVQDWCWLILCIALVLFAETMNTAFEYLCNVVQPELHASVKAAKDIAAGAVLIASIAAFIIGVLVFWPYLQAQLLR